MRRFEAAKVKEQNRLPTTLFEIDYSLGVNDEARQGAPCLSVVPDKNIFLAPKKKISIPPLIDLPKLLSATERFIAEHESTEDLRLLLAPGSSLGGARPKVSIRNFDGSLAIAQFQRYDDEFNIVVWDAVTLTLAGNAGTRVPKHCSETILGKSILIIKKFDRDGGNRIPFLSAMSLLGAHDNKQHSYLEMA